MKHALFICLLFIVSHVSFAQNYSVNQNQQNVNVNVNLPVIEKKVYIERYRTVYVDRPQPKRVARRLNAPVQLLGYLWVYPEDLGNFKQPPYNIIDNLNKLNSYGHNNWRIPTPDELAVLEANADRIGLGDDIYLATDHSNGVLRLVARPDTDEEKAAKYGGVLVGNTIWANKNVGAQREYDEGADFRRYDDASQACPSGWRLPTQPEFKELYYSGKLGEIKLAAPADWQTGERYGDYWTCSVDVDTSLSLGRAYAIIVIYYPKGELSFSNDHYRYSKNKYVRCVRKL